MPATETDSPLQLRMRATDEPDKLRQLTDELTNFQEIAKNLIPQPGELPRLPGIDVYGRTLALNGLVGGDHIIYVDFKQRFDLDARIAQAARDGRTDVVENLKRCQRAAGIAVVDVAGHRMTDALLAAMLHQAFLLGSIYELDTFGEITKRLFENLNTRFYQSSSSHKFISMIYGEISEDAKFRFLSAAAPAPAVFSRKEDRFMEVAPDLRVSFPPLGMLPSLHAIDRSTVGESIFGFKDRYQTNEWRLMGAGDILLLHTDGLSEHSRGNEYYFPGPLEEVLRRVKDQSAKQILHAIEEDLLAFNAPSDDISLVVIKLAGRG